MSTTYSYTISTCYRDSKNIVLNIVADWTATKKDSGITYTATKRDVISLDAAGDSPIDYATLDESTLKNWYANKLSTKLMTTDVLGKTEENEKTIEETIKETLDNDLEGEIYFGSSADDVTLSGLPY